MTFVLTAALLGLMGLSAILGVSSLFIGRNS